MVSAWRAGLACAALAVSGFEAPTVQRRFASMGAALAPAEALPLAAADASRAALAAMVDDDDEEAAKRLARLSAAEKPLDVFVVGLSHHNAKIDVREKLAIAEAEWETAAREIVEASNGAVAEAAVLSTCNRFEVYFSARDGRQAIAATTAYLQKRSGLAMGDLRSSLFMLSDEDAVAHAFKVSAGLDSLVVGEGQILAQMKACYAHAIDGAGGKVTSRLLNAAVAAGKRVRDETGISRGAVSISSAAYELAADRAVADLGMTVQEASVTMVGAGKMTRLLLTHMASHGLTKCVLVNRSRPRAQAMADEFKLSHDIDITVVLSDELEVNVQNADLVFTASSAEGFVIEASSVADRQRRLMLVDIAVPRNVDPATVGMKNVASYDVDSLKAVVSRNTAKRRKEIVAAEVLLEEDALTFRGWVTSLGAVPEIMKLQKHAEQMRQQEMRRANARLASLSQKEIEAVERLSRGIVSKLLHGPMTSVRDVSSSPEEKQNALSMLKQMFRF
ncbi:Glutamyl-tRNAGlu reductase [Pelagophyceae sp. CCMP2097]|nr:Glutamyl-tRNAGlu reductase [Pelagophyceae sp. CCMP2097]